MDYALSAEIKLVTKLERILFLFDTMTMKSSLTILFENPFWIGLYERIDGDKYEVCKITFGAEPKDYEVYDFLLKNWHSLKFSPPVKTDRIVIRQILPLCEPDG